ncbi:carbohydrate ABC transporter permease [Paenibacillus hexagrammi]|uniref:Carbohydrate ABC transporter permease n=1 Tax=Paenibacillus hexagrammi TaxID=2908839 RepID=A0ABY3SFP3_9BACL|nr:carbohydrate ABC transporter permease [Paenibacillus sp. YPD9-1]UJF32726.1 carbohydrate ABC transporter permease [Paenibacillus sp. YPD9-1]
MTSRLSNAVLSTLKYASLLLAVLCVITPPYVIVVNAFKSGKEYAESSPFAFPESFFHFANFAKVIEAGKLGQAFANTGIIIVSALVINIILGTMVAYALGRFNFKGKGLILAAYLVATFIPLITTQVATFSIIQALDLFNTKRAAILLYASTDAVQIYLYLQFISKIPYSLDESAMMEGASLFRIYRTIIFPLLGPATATAVILKTINIYNDMYIPWLYMPSQKLGVVSTSLMRFAGPNSAHWELICAAILIIMVPTIIIYLILQRFIFSGIVSGSVKE